MRLGAVLAAIGGLTLLGGLFVDPVATWANFLLVSYYLLGLGLGGLVFVAFLYVCGAGWGVALRRLPEALAILIPVACVGVVVVLLFYPSLYPWYAHSSEGTESGAAFRHLWLSRPLFLLRALVYFALWTGFAYAILRASRRQDADGKAEHTYTSRRLSAGFLVVFGATCWLSSVDWIMSLEPEWSSTIFGVYHFAGLFLGALAAIAAVAIYLERQGALRGILSAEHLHDLGTLLFSFSSFWMYIWFSQYMLIWYVNNPEETSYYVRRLQGGWQSLFFLNVLLNWVVPFVVLMPRATKENSKVLLVVALVLLVGRWVDLYHMILPALESGPLQAFGIVEMGFVAGGVGVFLLVVPRALGKASLLPVNDPFLVESLPHGKMSGNAPSCQDGNQSGILRGRGARHDVPAD
jgi:hypothetical protein